MNPVSEEGSIRFLSFANDKEDSEKEAKLREAASKIEQAISKQKNLSELVDYVPISDDPEIDPANDTRSLYDRLQEQKNKKKEAKEDSQRLSNLITKLDEDDARYLNEVARAKQEEEIKKRLEVYDALEGRKRANEKKMLEEEQRMKKALIGSHPQTKISPMKSKLALSFKVKPKQTSIQEPESQPAHKDGPIESSRSTGGSAEQSNPSASRRESRFEDSEQRESKRRRKDDLGKGSDEDNSSQPGEERLECLCSPENIMKCIGILPSLPIVQKFNDSSDSDDSNDDFERRITLNIRRNK